tara:strand:+ start:676 stop:1119 length:444 start_codon:yes stop_codon:yes gene_type:complete
MKTDMLVLVFIVVFIGAVTGCGTISITPSYSNNGLRIGNLDSMAKYRPRLLYSCPYPSSMVLEALTGVVRDVRYFTHGDYMSLAKRQKGSNAGFLIITESTDANVQNKYEIYIDNSLIPKQALEHELCHVFEAENGNINVTHRGWLK